MKRLRSGARRKTHHFSTFRSGLLIGAALPALASGIYYSASPSFSKEFLFIHLTRLFEYHSRRNPCLGCPVVYLWCDVCSRLLFHDGRSQRTRLGSISCKLHFYFRYVVDPSKFTTCLFGLTRTGRSNSPRLSRIFRGEPLDKQVLKGH